MLRTNSDLFRTYETLIPRILAELLRNCPENLVSVRREMLTAFRHVIATDMVNAFFPHVDEFMDEKLLFGTNTRASETLRCVLPLK